MAKPNTFQLPSSKSLRPFYIAGATATGKSEVAMCLAERFNGEIISVDSMQVYRGLDIGTAKPSAAERLRVPHHLIDIVGLNEAFDAAHFARLAAEAVREIQQCGRRPILCGGTGLYFKALLEGLGQAPPPDARLRAQLEATPIAVLLEELHSGDPATFTKIDRQNPRRVVRAVEVLRLTNAPISAQRADWWRPNAEGISNFWCLARSAEDLQARISLRVELMFRRGLVNEVRNLLSCGLVENRTAMQAIGYRQVVEHLRGGPSLAETIELVKIRTRQFAKRQMTWFRRQSQVKWVNCQSNENPEAIAAAMEESCD